MKISFIVFGESKPNDSEKIWEKLIIKQALKHSPPKLIEEAIFLGVKIFRLIPKSFSKKKQILASARVIRPETNPAFNDYLKVVKNILKGIIYKSDSQIVGFKEGTGKYYSENPRIEIEIETMSLNN